jgi:hypothetical protein
MFSGRLGGWPVNSRPIASPMEDENACGRRRGIEAGTGVSLPTRNAADRCCRY